MATIQQLSFLGRSWSSEGLSAPSGKKPRHCPKVTAELLKQLEMELQLPTKEEFLTMTDEAIASLREELIHRAFHSVVDGRVSKQMRREWIDWIGSNEIHPFSFVVCAIETGVNPLELREVFGTFIRRHHKQFVAEIPLFTPS
ncbi:MAG: hypothetical protein JAZ11_02875 [Candidatus Thiodiazotropha lotti]|nr:hypothetical protein [Candidatus Thiodiazotropha lotti]